MKNKNVQFLENLSTYSSFVGLFNIFLGLSVVILDYRAEDWNHIQVGFYIFITGFAFFSISRKVGDIVLAERKWIAEQLIKKEKEQSETEKSEYDTRKD